MEIIYPQITLIARIKIKDNEFLYSATDPHRKTQTLSVCVRVRLWLNQGNLRIVIYLDRWRNSGIFIGNYIYIIGGVFGNT
jgi:hypothetical protein